MEDKHLYGLNSIERMDLAGALESKLNKKELLILEKAIVDNETSSEEGVK